MSRSRSFQNPNPIPKEKKIYFTFYHLYDQDFYPEEASILQYLRYVARETPYEPIILPKEETNPSAHQILLGREELKDPIFLFTWIPREQIVFSTQNRDATFLNASMVVMTKHRQDEQCMPYTFESPHPQFPTFRLDFNTGRNLHLCRENEEAIQAIFDRATGASTSTSEPISFQPNLLAEKVFETRNYKIESLEGLSFQLIPKVSRDRIFLDRNDIENLFRPPIISIFLFENLFRPPLSQILSFNTPLDQCINCEIDPTTFKITQRSMIQSGEAFAQFYLQKHTQFKSILSKKYIMARYYIENLKHRNQEIFQPSNIFSNTSEFQNSYYLGFDLESFVVPFLQTRPHPTFYLLPLLCRIQGSDAYLVYHILIHSEQKKIFLFYAHTNQTPETPIDPRYHQHISRYLQHITEYSFLSKKPIDFQYAGLPPTSHAYRLSFLKPGHIETFHHHYALFQLLLNPRLDSSIQERQSQNIFSDKKLSLFIDFLRELETQGSA